MSQYQKKLHLGEVWENDTDYLGDAACIEVYEQDTVKCSSMPALFERAAPLRTAFYLKDKKNITLDFAGANIRLHERFQPFILENCENIAIRNCSVEYVGDFWLEGRVVEVGDEYFLLQPGENFPCRVRDGKLILQFQDEEVDTLDSITLFIQIFDQEHEGTGCFLALIGPTVHPEDNPPMRINQYVVSQENGLLRFSGHLQKEVRNPQDLVRGTDHKHVLRAGAHLAFSYMPRDKTSISMVCCKNIRIENYRIVNGAGMGIAACHTENIDMRGIAMFHDALSHGHIANSADGIHLISCAGLIRLTDSRIEGTMDDSLNIHSHFYHCENESANSLLVHKVQKLDNFQYSEFLPGDEIAIYRGCTLERKLTCKVTRVEVVAERKRRLIPDREIAVEPKDMVENLSTQPEVEIRNCTFAKQIGHLRLQSRGRIRISDCRFSIPILLTGDTNYWYEASPVRDLEIRNCIFATEKARIEIIPECHYTPEAPFYHENIRIHDNTFVSAAPLYARRCRQLNFSNNKNVKDLAMTLQLQDCEDVITDCTIRM